MSYYSQSSTTPGQAADTSRAPVYASSSYAPVGLTAAPKSSTKKQATPLKAKKLRSGGGQVWEDKQLDEFDENDFRIFAGDLGDEIGDEALFNAFKKYSSIVKAKVIRDKHTGRSKGYGFISFKNPNDFVRALKEMNGKYVGTRPIKLKKSDWKSRTVTPQEAKKLKETLPQVRK